MRRYINSLPHSELKITLKSLGFKTIAQAIKFLSQCDINLKIRTQRVHKLLFEIKQLDKIL